MARLIDIGVLEEEGPVDIVLYEPNGKTIRGVIHASDMPTFDPGYPTDDYIPEMYEVEGAEYWNRR